MPFHRFARLQRLKPETFGIEIQFTLRNRQVTMGEYGGDRKSEKAIKPDISLGPDTALPGPVPHRPGNQPGSMRALLPPIFNCWFG